MNVISIGMSEELVGYADRAKRFSVEIEKEGAKDLALGDPRRETTW